MKKLALVLMATMMLLFSFSATTSAWVNSTGEVYSGQLWLQSARMAAYGNITIPSQYADSYGQAEVTILVWKQYADGTWYNIQGRNISVTANGQSQLVGSNDLRYDQRQMNLQSGVYKVTLSVLRTARGAI
ncbi:hypothetical protein ACFQZE_04340 [Paenibacillus sp. GCM10027627]|uniref:hypothetical protein n=1 Tax=unclassified Paenibacillus TaxID=185978 RepID=UPI0036339C31